MSLLLRTGLGYLSKVSDNLLRKNIGGICRPSKFAQRRCLTTTLQRRKKETFEITFVLENGTRYTATGKAGDNLLDVVVNNNLDIDGFGACEGTLACSTCHLIFKPEDYKRLKETPTDEELDMLDLAYGLSDTSRLGCQVYLTKDLSGMEVKVPAGVNDARGTDT
ncbi:unnamed protein product [Ixodes pacificus]